MAPITEEQLLERLGRHQLVENVYQMSERYLEGIKRILTVRLTRNWSARPPTTGPRKMRRPSTP